MTQATPPATATAPSAAPAPAAAAPAHRGTAILTAPSARPAVLDTPRLLNRLQVIAVSVCILFGAVVAGLQVLAWHANTAAADNTDQLVRVQNIQSSLFRADALATNAFLKGGLEPTEQRQAYDAEIDRVSRQIADAAEAQPADRAVLADLNTIVTRYASSNELARANNRQGFPVGAEYLKTASAALRTEATPILTALADANAERASSEMDGQRNGLLVLPGLVALLVLWWVNRRLAATFRRRFNIGVAVAFATVLAVTLVGLFVSNGQSGDNNDLRDGSYRIALQEATARTAANDAKSNESQRLINRGSGQANEDAWDKASLVVQANATPATLSLWTTYADIHAGIVADDQAGAWEKAVGTATTTGGDGSTAALEAFDGAAQGVISDAAEQTTSVLRGGNTGILVLAVVSLLLSFAAAGAAIWGIGQRRREYA